MGCSFGTHVCEHSQAVSRRNALVLFALAKYLGMKPQFVRFFTHNDRADLPNNILTKDDVKGVCACFPFHCMAWMPAYVSGSAVGSRTRMSLCSCAIWRHRLGALMRVCGKDCACTPVCVLVCECVRAALSAIDPQGLGQPEYPQEGAP